MELNKGDGFALVLDTSPTVWTSVDEFHFRLCKALAARDVRPIVVYAAAPPPEYSARMTSSGADLAVLSYGAGKYAYFQGLGRLFRRRNVRIIQTRGFNYFSCLWWILRLRGIRKIVFLEGNSGLLQARSWKKALLRLRAQVATGPILRTVTVSKFMKRQLVELGMPEPRIRVIYNGVDRSRFRPDAPARKQWREEHGVGPEEILVATICYLRAFKNPHIVVEACALLAKESVPVRLFVSGTGELLEPMKQLSASLGIADRAHWLANYGQTEKLLQACDVFVLASVGEAIGNVLLEAMACGAPSVGSDSGGIPEIIAHGETGLLAASLDSAAFAGAIRTVACNPETRRRMSEQSLARAGALFDVDVTVRNFLELYDSL